MENTTHPPQVIVEYSKTEAALSELRTKYNRTWNVTTTAGMKEAREARAEIRALRTDLERKRKEIKAPLLEQCKLIDSEAARITSELEWIEAPIDQVIKDEEARKEQERQREEREARAKSDAALQLCNEMRAALTAMVGRSSAEISDQVKAMRSVKIPEDTHAADVQAVKDQVVAQLEALHGRSLLLEEEDKKRAAERVELERLRAEAKRQEEAAKAAAEKQRAEQERAAQAERDRIASEEKAARERIEAERRKAEIERQASEAKAAAERKAADDAAAKARAEADRQARLAREAEEAKLRQEREQLEAQRREADEKARREGAAAEAKAKAAREAEEEKARAVEAERIRSLSGLAMLTEFVSLYGARPEFEGIAGTIEAWLAEYRPIQQPEVTLATASNRSPVKKKGAA